MKQVEKRLEKAIKERDLPAEAIEHLRTRHQSRVQILPDELDDGLEHMRRTAKIKTELIEAEREFIYQLLRDGKITDEARRRIEYELDLEEASVANRGNDGGGGCSHPVAIIPRTRLAEMVPYRRYAMPARVRAAARLFAASLDKEEWSAGRRQGVR